MRSIARVSGAASTLTLLLAFSCKPPAANSNLQSLDNFANGSKINTNFCAASKAERKADKGRYLLTDRVLVDAETQKNDKLTKALLTEARAALTAVPSNIQKMFLALDGNVYIRSDVDKICSAGENPGGEAVACFRFGEDPDKKKARVLDIYLAADGVTIRHELVRQFAYVYTQFLARIKFEGMSGNIPNYTFEPESQKLLDAKLSVAKAFVADLDAQSVFPKRAFKGSSKNDDDVSGAADFIFAEAFDSYYCNNWGKFDPSLASSIKSGDTPLKEIDKLQNTRKVMETFFPKTFVAFKSAAKTLNFDVKKASFGLQDDGGEAPAPEPQVAAPVEQQTPTNVADDSMNYVAESPANYGDAAQSAQPLFNADPQAATMPNNGGNFMAGGGDFLSPSPAPAPDQAPGQGPVQGPPTATPIPNALLAPGGWYGGQTFQSDTTAGLLGGFDNKQFNQDLVSGVSTGTKPTANGPQIRIIDNNFIPTQASDGTKIGTIDPKDGRNYFQEPGTGDAASVASTLGGLVTPGSPSVSVSAAGDGRMPGEAGPAGRTARLQTVVDIAPNGTCSISGSCGPSHQRTTASALYGLSSASSYRSATAPVVTTTNTTVPGGNGVDATFAASYPFAPPGAAPNIDRRVSATVSEGQVPGSRVINYQTQSDSFPGRDQYVETTNPQTNEKRLYLLGGQLPDTAGPGLANLNTMGNYRQQRFTVDPSGQVFADGKPLPQVQRYQK